MTKNDDQKLEIFYDHYKDSFQHQLKYLENRNRYFLIVLLLIGVLFFQTAFPYAAKNIIESLSKKQFGNNHLVDTSFANSILLFGLLWAIILYIQANISIERQYKYIHQIEEKLSDQLSPFEISREGKTYKEEQPFIKKIIYWIYSLLFPVGLIGAFFYKAVIELTQENIPLGFLLLDLLLISVIQVLIIGYFAKKHFKKTLKQKIEQDV